MRTLLVFILVVAVGCSDDASTWSFDENPNSEPNNTSEPEPDPDMGSGPAPDMGTDPLCDASSLELGPSHIFPGDPQQAGRGLVNTSLGLGAVSVDGVRTWHPETGQYERPLEMGEIVIGSGGPTVLVMLMNDPERPYYAVNVTTDATPFPLTSGSNPNLAYFGYLDGDVPRLVDDDGTAVFIDGSRLMMWDTVEVFFVAEAQPYTYEIGEGRIGWLENTADGYTVNSWVFNDHQTFVAENQPQQLEVLREGLFWKSDVDLWWWPAGAEPRVIGEYCGPITFDRESRLAYYSCGEGEDGGAPYTLFQRALDGTTRTITQTDRKPYALTADSNIVVWAIYDAAGAVPFDTSGKIYGWTQGMEQPQELAGIGQGCLSCGAYWTPAEIILDDGLIAWSYAGLTDDGFPTRDDHVDVREIWRNCEE